MNSCIDWPCCGHEQGCCPDFDPETGEQLNMKCVCGASIPLHSSTSLCRSCLRGDNDYEDYDDRVEDYDDDDDYY